jgi:catechol 2,3-dioxygenase-like lactoylglutathione lyase family enzyme
MSIQGGVNQGGGSNPAANVNATPGGGGRPEPLTVDKLREVAGQNGITDLIRIGEVFEAAFLEATRGQVMPNDKRGPGNNYHVEEYKSSIRTALVRPDGLGRTATREGYGFINLVENSAFYEVKSGNTTLDEFYSRDNPKQLLAMLEVLSRNPAHKFGNATLFLVTPHGVTVNLVERARQYGVNVIQITPSLLEDGSVTFNKAMAHYVVPHGSLGRQIRPVQGNQIIPQAEVNLSFFNKPVPLRWQR